MKTIKLTTIFTALVLIMGCGGGEPQNQKKPAHKAEKSELTAFQTQNGIGPVTEEIVITTLDPELIKKGEVAFVSKCSACHKVDERYVGPALEDIVARRTPTYMMNMILNPAQMVKEHPEARKMLAEFMTPMPNQNLEQEEARAVVEYLVSLKGN